MKFHSLNRIIITIILANIVDFSVCAQERGIEFKWRKDGVILVGGIASFIAGEYAKSNVTPLTIMQVNSLDASSINALDRGATRQGRVADARTSDYLLLIGIVSPLSVLAARDSRKDVIPILVTYLETGLIVNGVTNITKGLVQRKRPFAYNPNTSFDRTSLDARHSFFSGHVSNAAAFSFLTAYMINEYSNKKSIKIIGWAGAITIPAMTGILRYTSGKHFPTDIITGYVVGAGIGVIIPYLHRRRFSEDFSKRMKISFSGTNFRVAYTF